jgi:hypothetical protein
MRLLSSSFIQRTNIQSFNLMQYKRSLGCVVNLKWNVEGRGISKPPPEYIVFVKEKRAEFILLCASTFLGAILLACVHSMFDGNLSTATLFSIFLWNSFGFAFGAFISYLA